MYYNMINMNKFRLWAGIVLAIVLAVVGLLVADIMPLPAPATIIQTRIIYILVGILISVMTFGKVVAWIVRTSTRLARQLSLKLAAEIIIQFNRASSVGRSILPVPRDGHQPAHPIILDTSSIIDGRVLDVAKTGFLSGLFILPDFVLKELQQVADSADPIKRQRGRKGFEVVSVLKKIRGIRVEVWDQEVLGKAVDDKLLRLAKTLNGKILTCDYNLNKVGQISGITVLNFNDLANALKSLYLPGEELNIKIESRGKEDSQGVGYLQDGTMVVIKDGGSLVGQAVDIEVSKVLQVPAGKMVFGKVIHKPLLVQISLISVLV